MEIQTPIKYNLKLGKSRSYKAFHSIVMATRLPLKIQPKTIVKLQNHLCMTVASTPQYSDISTYL